MEREQDTSCWRDRCVPTATEGLASASWVLTQLLGPRGMLAVVHAATARVPKVLALEGADGEVAKAARNLGAVGD